MIMSDAAGAELASMRCRFSALVADWGLTPCEVGALLGVGSPVSGPPPGDGAAEMRMRIFIDAARELERVLPADVLLVWLRDDEDGEVTPLAFMSRGVVELRAMRAAAAARGRGA